MVVLESVSGSFAVFKQLVLGRPRINLLFNNGLDRISPPYYQGSPSKCFFYALSARAATSCGLLSSAWNVAHPTWHAQSCKMHPGFQGLRTYTRNEDVSVIFILVAC